jgi:DNA-binding CsgD family transcriptional regulator
MKSKIALAQESILVKFSLLNFNKFRLFFTIAIILLLGQSCNKQSENVNTDTSIIEKKELSDGSFKFFDSLAKQGEFEFALSEIKKQQNKINENSSKAFDLNLIAGNFYYALGFYDSAEYCWKKAESSIYRQENKIVQASLLTNLGVINTIKGYNKTAIDYFLKAKIIFEKHNIKDDNYWKNYINIGVAYLSLMQFEEAKKIFNQIDEKKSIEIAFLLHFNKSKVAALEINKEQFIKELELAKNLLAKVPIYQNVFKDHEYEYLYQFKEKEVLKELVENDRPYFSTFYLYSQLQYIQASIFVGEILPVNIDYLIDKKTEVESSDDLYLKSMFYSVIAQYYESKNMFELAVEFLKLEQECIDDLRNESNTLLLNDYKYLLEINSNTQENELLKKQKQIQTQKLQTQKYISFLFVLLFFALIIILVIIFINVKKNKELIKSKIELSRLEILTYKNQQAELQKKIIQNENKFHAIKNQMGKIAILKKQMEDFFDELSNKQIEDIEVKKKKAKLNMNSFFSNYQDLAIIASVNEETFDVFQNLNKKYPCLKENEIKVLTLLKQNYTTKEIASLLSYSEKNIEYIRAQIRRKLNLDAHISLSSFVETNL